MNENVEQGNMVKILITGADGQLGKEFCLLPKNGEYEIVGLNRNQLDITSKDQCEAAIAAINPHVIIHCAAYTAVDQAELEPELAFAVNAKGTENIAAVANQIEAKLICVSTDYVFDGQGNTPYKINDTPRPQTVYGKSKLAGEELAKAIHNRVFIVRTSWVYGLYGQNFVKTMIKIGEEKGHVKVVEDQIGSPTYTRDLAECLLELAATEKYGVYHASNSGSCSWYQFAQAIFEEAGLTVRVEPCCTADFPRPAPRPAYSVLDQSALLQIGLTGMPHWRVALKDYFKTIKQ
ncbi:dTDP-4-dehydrorhamnose reductase [Paenibacillus sp. P22]|uniref:dTDP-4-dehydrorhamnose reductase n=1 Tax=Paenibacillus sp. P22 TaxID=483908 RepID=UPI000431DC55|nr:dTDP-4-dehydrorhamnose reductase [Paenibacillus sp. P22]CDN46120.1 Spore coat polysaccharide biosynthesis protein SpsK [Paenibacillus sp. P22]